MTSQRVLVIDDDPEIGDLICSAAQELGQTCTATVDLPSFLRELSPDTTLIVIDLVMPRTDGVEVLRLLARRGCRASIVLVSGLGQRVVETAEALAASLGRSVAGRLLKPFRYDNLEALLQTSGLSSTAREPTESTFEFSDDELRQALREGELVLFYQPQVDIEKKTVCGVEALVRWQHPTLGLRPPDTFLPRLEELGLMGELGCMVVDLGLAEFQKLGPEASSVCLSINISVSSLHDLSFPDVMASLLEKHGLRPEQVVLEITESGILPELSRTLDVLSRLRMKGIRLSIDDFGVGYSMMRQLRQIPATELKIDRSFIQKSETSPEDRLLVRKMVEIGHELGLRVVAEGWRRPSKWSFWAVCRVTLHRGTSSASPCPLIILRHGCRTGRRPG